MKKKEKSTAQVVREGLERACKEFTKRIAALGFQRANKMFWTRRHPFTVDFIQFERGDRTRGAAGNVLVRIRVFFGIRVLNDSRQVLSLNGIWSDAERERAGRYHMRFDAQSGDTYERCIDDLVRFVAEQGEPWFQRFRSTDDLLRLPDSPLESSEEQLLADAIAGKANSENEANSLRILGLNAA